MKGYIKIVCSANAVNRVYLVLNPVHTFKCFVLKHNRSFCDVAISISFFSELKRRLNESETEKFNVKQMKDLFEQKAAQLATEIVGKFCRKVPAFYIYVSFRVPK